MMTASPPAQTILRRRERMKKAPELVSRWRNPKQRLPRPQTEDPARRNILAPPPTWRYLPQRGVTLNYQTNIDLLVGNQFYYCSGHRID